MRTRVAATILVALGAATVAALVARKPRPAPRAYQDVIVFTRTDRAKEVTGPPELWAANADGTGLRLLARAAESPVWSPDGRTIAFVKRGLSTTSICVIGLQGGEPGYLTAPGPQRRDYSPCWSPDGEKVAFVRCSDDGQSAIHAVGADGSGEVRLTAEGFSYGDPAWSPDGRLIAVAGSRDFEVEESAIYVMHADGSGVRRLTKDGVFGGHPRWSPDGTRIAFERFPEEWREFGTRTDLCVVRADGGGLRVLVRKGGSPTWSPDGRAIAYDTPGLTGSAIWIVPAGGGVPTCLAEQNYCCSPAWSSDGHRVVFSARAEHDGESYNLFTMNADGSGRMALTSGPADDERPVWQPRVSAGGPDVPQAH